MKNPNIMFEFIVPVLWKPSPFVANPKNSRFVFADYLSSYADLWVSHP